MNRTEALHTLGLDTDATIEDIKTAYKESAQILHPDRFANNKKLADRATEQFKNLQEAYEFLMKNPRGGKGGAQTARSHAYAYADQLNARLAGIDAARVQLVAQRDSFLDQRRTGWMLISGGLLCAVLLRRLRPIAAIAGAAVVWGVIDVVAAGRNLEALNKQIDRLKQERAELLREVEKDEEPATAQGDTNIEYEYEYVYVDEDGNEYIYVEEEE